MNQPQLRSSALRPTLHRPTFHRPIRLGLLLGLLSVASCAIVRPGPSPGWSFAAGGVEHSELAQVCRDAWELHLKQDPQFATLQKDNRYYGEMADLSQAGRRRFIRARQGLIERLLALNPDELDDAEALTHEWLIGDLEGRNAVATLAPGDWIVDPLRGPQSELLSMAEFQPMATAEERAHLVERWQAMERYIRQYTSNLQRGKAAGKVSSRTAIEKTIEQIDTILSTSPMDSPLLIPALGGGEWVPLARGETVSAIAHKFLGSASRQHVLRQVNRHLQDGSVLALGTRVLLPAEDDVLSPIERGRFLSDVMSAIEDRIYPAFGNLRTVLASELLPVARTDDQPGLAYIPGGRAAYRTRIEQHTSLRLAPEEIHQTGLDEIARIRAEMSELGEELFGTRSMAEIQARLRDDPAMHFNTPDEVEAKAAGALARASLALPQWFGLLPAAKCIVEPIPEHEAPYSTIAYYQEPASDGSRPGIYYVNTFAPETRPTYEAEVLAYHEAVPGHHLQIAIAQELESLPLVRRHAHCTAFAEGWALYTERLCDEMGLYSDTLDRIGMLSYDAWRASRLVVDTGLHAFGWSRQRAIDYMIENTLLAANNIENEVDRYIAWPGQALAYKIGQRRILDLRDEAREALGDRFDMISFHDRVLENGAITLPILTRAIRKWIAETRISE